MAGDQHVREGTEPVEEVVADHLVREVLEEQVGLLLVHVQSQVPDPAALEAVDDGGGVDQRAAARVHQHRARTHQRDAVAVDEVERLGCERAVERHDVGAGEQLLERHVCGAGRLGLRARIGVVRQDAASEPGHDPGEAHADLAGADHTDRASVQVETEQAVQREIVLAHPVVGPVGLPVEREDERRAMLGDRIGGVAGDAGDAETEFGGGLEVDVIEPRRSQGDVPDAVIGKDRERLRPEVVVDERADRLASRCQRRGVGCQAGLQEQQFVARAVGGPAQVGLVVGFGAEHGSAHEASPQQMLAGRHAAPPWIPAFTPRRGSRPRGRARGGRSSC
nr:hypothetical protein [Glycomyces sp. YM15]